MSSFIITGNTVIFKNPFGEQNIILKHNDTDYDLIFDSKVKFKKGLEYTSIDLGVWKIKTLNDGNELIISKNDKTLLKLKE